MDAGHGAPPTAMGQILVVIDVFIAVIFYFVIPSINIASCTMRAPSPTSIHMAELRNLPRDHRQMNCVMQKTFA